jgi:Zn-dependent protease
MKLQLNWFFTAALVTWSLAGGYFPIMFPNYPASTYWLYGGISSLIFFASVLVHEIGHAVVSMDEGVPVKSISLFIFGGMAHISREPSTPRSEFRIVAAGPFASLLLAALLTTISTAVKSNQLASGAAFYLGQLNFILAFFNLIPGFPLDGGRLLRSVLWAAKRDFLWATRWAVNVGLVIAAGAVLAGAVVFMMGYYFNGIWILFIGVYLGYTARASYQQSIKYAPWPEIHRRITPSKLESITLRHWGRNYRAAILRVETVNHNPLQMIAQPILIPVEERSQNVSSYRDNS